jgi:uncharacterized membrane protein YbhN (UPF0104 family)
MVPKRLRPALAALVLVATAAVFIYYIHGHPAVFRVLGQVPLATIALIGGLYVVFMVTLIWIQRATLELCDIRLGRKESAILMAYSSIINFFGPLQSGPAFRAAYLKRKHSVNLKQYTLASFLYYGFYGAFSGGLLLAFVIGWWSLLAVAATGLVIVLLAISKREQPLVERLRSLRLIRIGDLALATLAQVFVISIIYYVELRSLHAGASYFQVLAYSGAANFALFVSLTPGAIGFRESFLVFSQHIHQVSNSNIIAASLIDRGVYIAFLGILAIIVFGLHAQNYLKQRA